MSLARPPEDSSPAERDAVDVRAWPAGIRCFSLDALSVEPWRNGAGVTRTVAHRLVDGRPLWRISVADIGRNGPFSRFDGLDRVAVLVAGRGLTLCGDWGSRALHEVGDMARFRGEWAVRAELSSPSARLWNVMADRAHAQIELTVTRDRQALLEPGGEGALMLLEGEADVLCNGHLVAMLKKDNGLRLEPCPDGLRLRFKEGPAHWLQTMVKPR